MLLVWCVRQRGEGGWCLRACAHLWEPWAPLTALEQDKGSEGSTMDLLGRTRGHGRVLDAERDSREQPSARGSSEGPRPMGVCVGGGSQEEKQGDSHRGVSELHLRGTGTTLSRTWDRGSREPSEVDGGCSKIKAAAEESGVQ